MSLLARAALAAVVTLGVGAGSAAGVEPSSPASAGPVAGQPVGGAPARPHPLRGLRVAIDPGHNGGNSAHPQAINQQVPDGRGGRKACNTVGTSTVGGYPEHALVWNLAIRLRNLLRAHGATVTVTRSTDHGVGPCVDHRGRWPQAHHAQVMVSIHANGSTDRSLRGFHLIRSWPALSRSQRAPSRRLSYSMRNALRAAGFAVSPVYGQHGIDKRSDLATLNFARRPTVLAEVGEMRNRHDAGVLTSKHGRSHIAHALLHGLRRWATHR